MPGEHTAYQTFNYYFQNKDIHWEGKKSNKNLLVGKKKCNAETHVEGSSTDSPLGPSLLHRYSFGDTEFTNP